MDKGECRERLNIPKEAAVLGYLGRIGKLDLVFAYETMRKVAEITGREDTLLVVAGGYRGAYHEIEPVYLKDDFIYVGFIQNSDAPLMLNSCDVFLNPVAGAWEGFGLTVVEAMACGLPVVTTNWDGYTDTVVDGKTGFLSRTCWKDGDVWINQQDLSLACAKLIADEDLRAQMGKEARRRAEQNYKWEYCIDGYRKEFLELIDKGTPSEVPYSRAPQEINVIFDNTRRCYSLSEALSKRDELRLDFGKLYEDFVSNRRMKGDDWKRVVCADNIINLPKYRGDWETAFEKEKTRIERAFPLIVKLSGYS